MASVSEAVKLALGDRYLIEREIGAGGMATVYLAQDLKHRRKVALKVLRPELTAIIGGERFLQEIEVTAGLQHPNILPLYDSGDADGFLYYVMPYAEGETLRAKLDREKQLTVEETVAIATTVASALQYAHRQGVIHRDIKPENILIHDGHPLVADFGIALAVSQAGGTRLTETGLSLGTPHYVSPRAGRGRSRAGCADRRLLAGCGDLRDAHRRPTPHRQHDAGDRRQGSHGGAVPDLADATDGPAQRGSGRTTSPGEEPGRPIPSRGGLRRGPHRPVLQALAPRCHRSGTRAGQRRLVGSAGVLHDYRGNSRHGRRSVGLAIAPDASALVYVASLADGVRLVLKERQLLEATPISGTEGGFAPFFSPDGTWIGFVSDGKLRKVPRSGGETITLADSANVQVPAGAWLDDGTIIYIDSDFGLRRVSEAGGATEVVLRPGEHFPRGPVDVTPLPEGRGVLLTACDVGCAAADVYAFDVGADTAVVLFTDAWGVWYAPTGHVVYTARGGGAFAAPFDLDALEVRGAPVQLLDNVRAGDLAFSSTGTLIYVTEPPSGTVPDDLVWVDRKGATEVIDPAWSEDFEYVDLSPDGRRLAVSIQDRTTKERQLWVKQLDGGPLARLTFAGTLNFRAAWAPDGQSIAFISNRGGKNDIWHRRVDRSSADELLLEGEGGVGEVIWSPHGRWLVYRVDRVDRRHIYGFRPGVDTVPTLIVSEFNAGEPALSPDGRWLAYVSEASGRNEVYVRPFPDTGAARWQISSGGGQEPLWAHSGRELFYRTTSRQLVAAEIITEPLFGVGEQRILFSTAEYEGDRDHRTYDVSADDRRFVMIRRSSEASNPQLVLVENWFEELKQRVRQ